VRAAERTRDRYAETLRRQQQALANLDPQRVLERGYTITRDADGKVLTRAAAVAAGSTLAVAFADGTATARVERVERDPERGGEG
jgi:exodeoxyribonuclease VII large subunit